MKTLYLHIGTIKTGTKSLQCFCWENSELLKKQGYIYPDLSCLSSQCISIKNAHFMVEDFESEEEEMKRQQAKEKYREGMEQIKILFSTYDNIILSDEGIYNATYRRRETLWEELKADAEHYGFTVKIIVYLRRQDELMLSTWNQHIKTKRRTPEQSWEEFISAIPRRYQLNYFNKLEKIASVLGKENIIVRRFGRDFFLDGSIYADFLQAVGLVFTEEYHISKCERNKSLSGNTHEIMRILNGVPGLANKDLRIMRNILRIDGEISKLQYPTSMFSKREYVKFMKKYRKSNRLVAEKYLGRPGEDLFDYTHSSLPKWTADNPYMQQDIIRFIALCMKKMRIENKKLRAEYKKMHSHFAKLELQLEEMAK